MKIVILDGYTVSGQVRSAKNAQKRTSRRKA